MDENIWPAQVVRTVEKTIADAWADDEGGVTLEVTDGRASLTADEAHAYGQLVMQAGLEAAQAIRERNERPVDTTPF